METAQTIMVNAKIAAQSAAGFPLDDRSCNSDSDRWHRFIQWRRENPSLVFKAGDEIRPGLYFHRYAKTCRGYVFLRPESWMEERKDYMRRYRRGVDRTPGGWLSKLTSNARVRGLEVDGDLSAIAVYFGKPCHYCGDAPAVSHGVDRVDNTRGYVRGNMVPCCKHCNLAKGTRTQEEFAAWVHRASAHLKKGGAT